MIDCKHLSQQPSSFQLILLAGGISERKVRHRSQPPDAHILRQSSCPSGDGNSAIYLRISSIDLDSEFAILKLAGLVATLVS
jgi:hypothetical protein